MPELLPLLVDTESSALLFLALQSDILFESQRQPVVVIFA